MVEYSKLIITADGQKLMAKMIAGTGNVEFIKVCASSAMYTEEQLMDLTSLDDIQQISLISNVVQINDNAIKIETAFNNSNITNGYYMRTLGLYAVDPDEGEILYAACVATSDNCYMPSYNGVTTTGAYINMYQTVGNSSSISLNVNSGAFATIGDIKRLEAELAKNMFNILPYVTHDIGIIKDDGTISNGSDAWDENWENPYVSTSFIGVKQGDRYNFKCNYSCDYSAMYGYWYDCDKKPIKKIEYIFDSYETKFIAPSDGYIRFCFWYPDIDTVKIETNNIYVLSEYLANLEEVNKFNILKGMGGYDISVNGGGSIDTTCNTIKRIKVGDRYIIPAVPSKKVIAMTVLGGFAQTQFDVYYGGEYLSTQDFTDPTEPPEAIIQKPIPTDGNKVFEIRIRSASDVYYTTEEGRVIAYSLGIACVILLYDDGLFSMCKFSDEIDLRHDIADIKTHIQWKDGGRYYISDLKEDDSIYIFRGFNSYNEVMFVLYEGSNILQSITIPMQLFLVTNSSAYIKFSELSDCIVYYKNDYEIYIKGLMTNSISIFFK